MSNTIKMWGAHLDSDDTKKKLIAYRKLKNHDPQSVKDVRIPFDYPLDTTYEDYIYEDKGTFDLEKAKIHRNRNLSARAKKKHFEEVYEDSYFSKPLSTQPYVNLVLLPEYKRPKTLAECIDFFYPMSGPQSYLSSQSPFISTFPGHYAVEREQMSSEQKTQGVSVKGIIQSKNTMPVDLGEVTIMYAWFTIYRLLLCPKTFSNSIILPQPEDLFGVKTEGEARILFESQLQTEERQFESSLETISNFKTATDIAKDLANQMVKGEIKDPETFAEALINNENTQKFIQLGVSSLSTKLSGTFGLSKESSNTLAGWIAREGINPKTYKNLTEDAKVLINQFSEKKLTELLSKVGYTPSDSDKALLRKLIIEGEIPEVDFEKLSKKGKEAAKEFVSSNIDRYAGNFKKAFAELSKTIRENPRRQGARHNGVILATMGISAGAGLIKKGLDAEAQRLQQNLNAMTKYFTTFAHYMNPVLAEEGLTFALDDFKAKGLKVEVGRFVEDHDWGRNRKPYCGPLNGGMVKDYITDIYRVFKPLINHVRLKAYANEPVNIRQVLRDAPTILKAQNINPNAFAAEWTCHTFDIFLQHLNPIRSTQYVFRDIDHFSEFTQAFGFEPTFLQRSKLNTQNAALNELSRDWGNKTKLAISGSAYQNGWLYAHQSKGVWVTPGMKKRFSYMNSHDDAGTTGSMSRAHWTMEDVRKLKGSLEARFPKNQKGEHQVTLNSQRKITDENPNGYYGFTDIGFDVAYRDDNGSIPIMNAQWPAIISVIYCYPEALEMFEVGYEWAKELKSKIASQKHEREIEKQKALKSRLSFISRLQPKSINAQLKELSVREDLNMKVARDTASKLSIDVDEFRDIVKAELQGDSFTKATGDKQEVDPSNSDNAEETSNKGLAIGLGAIALSGLAFSIYKWRKKK